MKLWVGITDSNWFSFLSSQKPDEVNFWQPGGTTSFKALSPGEPFLFKLHSPKDFIVGGGFFVRQTKLPLSLAWEAFEQRNGVEDFATFKKLILRYRGKKGQAIEHDPTIGCSILTAPFFLPQALWVGAPEDWSKNIVQGKTYDLNEALGASLWTSVRASLQAERVESFPEIERGESYSLVKNRLGQGAFRVLVTEAYTRRCAMTGERTLPVLQAAHIKPYSLDGRHQIENGMLLRSDLHILFDKGYLTVTADMSVEVSRKLKEDFENGRDYYALHGKPLLILPQTQEERPHVELLQWHNENVYLA